MSKHFWPPSRCLHILLCCAWGNKDRTVINLSQPSGCWEEAENGVMLVELLPVGTEIKLTVEV